MNLNQVHSGGDGIALVMQNQGATALGGIGKNLGTAKGDDKRFTLGIQDALAVEIRTFDEPGFLVRACGSPLCLCGGICASASVVA